MTNEMIEKQHETALIEGQIYSVRHTQTLLEEVCYSRGFKAGAIWFRNNVWHDSDKDQPAGERGVVIWNPHTKYGEILERCIRVYEHQLWAYLEDVLPDEKEEC